MFAHVALCINMRICTYRDKRGHLASYSTSLFPQPSLNCGLNLLSPLVWALSMVMSSAFSLIVSFWISFYLCLTPEASLHPSYSAFSQQNDQLNIIFFLWNFLNMRTQFHLNKFCSIIISTFSSPFNTTIFTTILVRCVRGFGFIFCHMFKTSFNIFLIFHLPLCWILYTSISISLVFSTLLYDVLSMVSIMVLLQWLYQLIWW